MKAIEDLGRTKEPAVRRAGEGLDPLGQPRAEFPVREGEHGAAGFAPAKKRRIRLLLALASPVVAFVLCEVGFRIYEAVQLARAGELWATYDAELGWRLNPEYGDHNEYGLRDRPIAPKGERERILFLGDSLLYYGDDVDDTVVGRLRAELAASDDPGDSGAAGASRAPETIDVVNAGVKGYTNWQELGFLKSYGLRLEPDVVGVGFVLNDCYRMLHQFRVEDGRIVGQGYDFSTEATESESFVRNVLRKSHFLVWVRRNLPSFEGTPSDGYSFDYRPDFEAAWRDEPWVAIEAQLTEMVELGEADGFPLFLVAFPFADQYRAKYLARDRDYVLKPQRKLAEICERLAIPFLDLYPMLDAATDIDEDKIHLTASGREKAAEAIARFLEERGLVGGA